MNKTAHKFGFNFPMLHQRAYSIYLLDTYLKTETCNPSARFKAYLFSEPYLSYPSWRRRRKFRFRYPARCHLKCNDSKREGWLEIIYILIHNMWMHLEISAIMQFKRTSVEICVKLEQNIKNFSLDITILHPVTRFRTMLD